MVAHATCPRCKGVLPADAPEGLCPECLLRQVVEAPGTGLVLPEETGPPVGGFAPPAPADLARHFPQLEILEFIGQGGMGAVYKARQIKLDRLVALKVLPPGAGADAAFAERFTREARALARLSHPNIVGVHDFGETGGLYYLVMEYVDGVNLRQLLHSQRPEPAQAMQIMTQVCGALQYAHGEGVVHRDIKPENILLDRRGNVKIADFGLAKLRGGAPPDFTLTGTNQVMGTPHYMAPEQMERTAAVDHRADIYSLGVVFYELLTGELPLGRFPPPSKRAGVDARLDEVVLRALERDPDRRYQQASDISLAVRPLHPPPAGDPLGFTTDWREVLGMQNFSSTFAGEIVGLAGIAACLALLGLGTWWTRSGYFILGHSVVASVGHLLLGRRPARVLGGLLLLLGFFGLCIVTVLATSGHGWWPILVTAWISAFACTRYFGEKGPRRWAEEETPAGLTAEQGEIWRVLKRFEDSAGIYLLPDIPAGGLYNARKASNVPPEQRVLGLIDFTDDEDDMCYHVLFSSGGLFVRARRGKQFVGESVPYAEFPTRVFVNHVNEVYLGNDQFVPLDPDEGPVDGETLTSILNALREEMVRRRQGAHLPAAPVLGDPQLREEMVRRRQGGQAPPQT